MVSADLLEMLRCPVCVREEGKTGELKLERDVWLVCTESGCDRKYPIRDDIPVMLVEEGDKWVSTVVGELPVPPPGDE